MRFNEVFSEDASQEQIFEQCGVTGLVLKALEGYSTDNYVTIKILHNSLCLWTDWFWKDVHNNGPVN
jgi:hypothetical protein